jgi:hypothetical protein
MSFEFFDPDCEVRISTGSLPHWYQPGVTYFITFRTVDAFPRVIAEQWYRRRDDWLRQHGIVAGTLRVPPAASVQHCPASPMPNSALASSSGRT